MDDRTTWPKSPWVVLSTYKERKKSRANLAQLREPATTARLIVAGLWKVCSDAEAAYASGCCFAHGEDSTLLTVQV